MFSFTSCTCCDSPWVCKGLPDSITDDIEMCVCTNQDSDSENIGVEILHTIMLFEDLLIIMQQSSAIPQNRDFVCIQPYFIVPSCVLLCIRICYYTTTKGVIKCLLPVARLRDAFATRARPETAILQLRSQRDG